MAYQYRNWLTTGALPLRRGFGLLIFFILYKVVRYRYAEVIQNLSRSFPEKSYGEIKKIAAGFYRYFSCLFPEIISLLTVSRKDIPQRLRLHNAALLQHSQAQGRNVIIMMGHYGNWEYMSMLPAFSATDMYAVYKPLSNRFTDRLMKKLRARFGMKLLAMEEAPKHMLQAKRPATYIFIADQSPAQGSRFTTDFLHQRTVVITGAERLARATDAVVLYAAVNREDDGGGWEISFSLITDDPDAMGQHAITKKFTQYLEDDIRRCPACWLWTHRRWKLKTQ
ncbi:MAG TPA: lysophospholipid acyltransferase family protein [Chitinophaga sp.]|uniref:lysophospholipid acyltransferase family protein n=1 Tax=Chitinophaga sp. TaxID=1869181 RepID=UPI002BA7CCC7|nr:lysophospholipid acyltransferase family protein [Chitinophaga sp.]HVI46426.1 lysophospholipid acyltransferase family protein [Chitinophaga sp.]